MRIPGLVELDAHACSWLVGGFGLLASRGACLEAHYWALRVLEARGRGPGGPTSTQHNPQPTVAPQTSGTGTKFYEL
jgi:hypothetical protein